jgi:hypothetical protein
MMMGATGMVMRRGAWIALALGACAVASGCSHAPKPSAEAGGGADPPKHVAAHAKPATAPPSGGVVSGASTSAPADSTQAKVLPTLTPAEAKEMEATTKTNVDAARTMLAGIDATKLDTDHARKFEIAKGLLSDAVAARTQQDWTRASQLATKAKLLAEELTGQ